MSSTTGSSAFADDDTEESRGLRAIILDDGRILHWLGRTPVQTFILCPLAVVGFEFAREGVEMTLMLSGIPLLLWGYLQYRFVGRYRRRLGGGGPGMEAPPQRIVAEGPYQYTRNPMYLAHLIFMAGLALTFWSWFASSSWCCAPAGSTTACSAMKSGSKPSSVLTTPTIASG
jgi:protein-S-isoprenylcysteine O-methyltransferase Ste14